jgi:Rrf2 family transcriptional regulator, nitric oxide-sensitive transcriptional repressor
MFKERAVRLTVYTDYTLRVMMYLAVAWPSGRVATIDEMAGAYDISRSHLTKIVHELGLNGFIVTTRGRAGGARLARPPDEVSIGDIVRMAEEDFSVVACHDNAVEHGCRIFPACNLKRGLARAVDAFMAELDAMTLQDAITVPTVAASLLGMGAKERPAMAMRSIAPVAMKASRGARRS